MGREEFKILFFFGLRKPFMYSRPLGGKKRDPENEVVLFYLRI